MKTTIRKRIFLESKYLDKKIKQHLLSKLREKMYNECTNDIGYILHIEDDIKIISNINNVFIVEFNAEIFKPEPNDEYDSKICMIYKDGIFVDIKDRQKMLIPASSLKDYTYNDENNTFYKDDLHLSKDDIIRCKISAVRYNNRKFSCFGSLV